MSGEPSTQPILYMIRHGEKPPKKDGKDQDGLSAQGQERADNLPTVFGKDSTYDIGFIMAQDPHHEGQRRPLDTVKPLAHALGLKVHHKVHRDDYAKAASEAFSFKGPGNILLCWEHHALTGIANAIGIKGYAPVTGWTGPVVYPEDRFDLVWVVPPPYTEITEIRSEHVPGLDNGVHVNANGDVPPPPAQVN